MISVCLGRQVDLVVPAMGKVFLTPNLGEKMVQNQTQSPSVDYPLVFQSL